jgi:hypothetical protein
MEAHVGFGRTRRSGTLFQYVIDEQCEFMALFGAKEIERDPSVFKLGFSEWATGVL